MLAALPLAARDVDPLQAPDTQLEPVAWSDIDGWADDDHAAAFGAFRTSCNPFLARRAGAPTAGRSTRRCARSAGARRPPARSASDKAKARAFFEENFRPVRIAKLGESTGLLTGYYEPIVDGSRFPNPEFSAPLYRRPRDILIGGKKAPKAALPEPGQRRPLQRQEGGRALFRSRSPSRTARSTGSGWRSPGSRITGRR